MLPSAAEKIGGPHYRTDPRYGMSEQTFGHRLRLEAPSRQKCEKPAQGRRWRERPYEGQADI